MNWQQRAELGFAAAAKDFAYFVRVEVECGGVDVGEDGAGSGAHDGAGRGEEAERGGENPISGLHSRGGQSEPQSVGAGGTSHSLAGAAEIGHFALELVYLGT